MPLQVDAEVLLSTIPCEQMEFSFAHVAVLDARLTAAMLSAGYETWASRA